MNTTLKYILVTGLTLLISCSRQRLLESSRTPKIEFKEEPRVVINWDDIKEIVIEGTVIAVDRKFYHNTVFSSCLVEVNTIYNGLIEEKVIEVLVQGGAIGDMWVSLSHGQITLPPINSTAIFRIKELEDNDPRKEFRALTPFRLFYGRASIKPIFPDGYYLYDRINIEKEVYQKLEEEFHRRRKLITSPVTINEVAIKYSTRNNLLLPNRKKGLVYKLSPINDTKKENFLGFNVLTSSSNSVVYFNRGELIIEYNTDAFGDSIVTKKNLIYDIPRNYNTESASAYNSIPSHYEVNCFDISSNRFKIEWINTGNADNSLQLLPSERGVFFASLYFRPQKMEEQMNLKLFGVDSMNLQYDYKTDKVIPFEYVATNEIQNYRIVDLMPATITSIYPDGILEILDTIQLKGKNFGKYPKLSMYSIGTSGHYRYREIPESYVLSKSDTLISVIIPQLTLSKGGDDYSKEWFPTSGKIRLTKGYGRLTVNTWSKEQIRIENTAPNKR